MKLLFAIILISDLLLYEIVLSQNSSYSKILRYSDSDCRFPLQWVETENGETFWRGIIPSELKEFEKSLPPIGLIQRSDKEAHPKPFTFYGIMVQYVNEP